MSSSTAQFQAEHVGDTLLQTDGLGQHHIPGTGGEAGGELVVSRDGVSTRAAGRDRAGAQHLQHHLLPGLWVLGLIADDHIILSGERHITHVKLHPATFQHAGKACPCPGSWTIWGGLTLHH